MRKLSELSLPERALRDAIRPLPGLYLANDPGAATQFDNNKVNPWAQAAWDYGAVLPVGAAAAGLWYLNRRRKKKKQQQLEAAHTKTAALEDVLRSIAFHMPKIRPVDTAAGMLVGGLGGGLYDYLRTPKGQKRQTLRRALLGALVGAGAANLAGDRARRYVTNMVPPFGKGYGSDTMKQLIPGFTEDEQHAKTRGWAGWARDAATDLKDGLILDKPRFKRYATNQNELGSNVGIPEDIWQNIQGGRDELVRRGFGLPVRDIKNPYWQKNPEGHYSLNEQSPDYATRLRHLFGNITGKYQDRSEVAANYPLLQHFSDRGALMRRTHDRLLHDPQTTLALLNQNAPGRTIARDLNRNIRLFGGEQLMGDQQIPHQVLPTGAIAAQTLDRWDMAPEKVELDHLKQYLKNLANKDWQNAPSPQFGTYIKPTSHTNAQAAKIIGARWLWDNVLSDELPWVSQKFQLAPEQQTRAWGSPGYNLQFLKQDNSPATPPMNADGLRTWMEPKS